MTFFIAVLGMSGAGKSTHSDIFVENNLKYQHLSMSELLKEEIRNEKIPKETRFEIENKMKNGILLDADLTWTIAKKALDKIELSKIVLFDGYPRNLDCLWRALDSEHCLLGIVFLQTAKRVMRERMKSQLNRNDNNSEAQKNREAFLPEMEKVLSDYQIYGPVVRIDVNDSNFEDNQQRFVRAVKKISVFW